MFRLASMVATATLLMLSAAWSATDVATVASATYNSYSLSTPTPSLLTVCHGFSCQYRVQIALSGRDHAVLRGLMASGKSSAQAERHAIARAGAWFDRRIAAAAGTKGHVARAGVQYMNDKRQFDCIDSSRNTTSLLLVLNSLHLLRYHDIVSPVARGHLFDGRAPHVTAVIRDRATGTDWAVDSWTRGYGQSPEIVKLSIWQTQD